MGSAVSVVEAVGLETSAEAFGQISDAGEFALADDRKRAVVGIGSGAVAGGMMDLALATSAVVTGPLGVIASVGVSMLASQAAKSLYDTSFEPEDDL
jgi:hypothetical protein